MKTATRKDWEVKPMPRQRAQLIYDRAFSAQEMELIKRGFVPQAMEQKWFIFFERNRLYVHRSWTGYCIYIAQFKKESNGYAIARAEVNRDGRQYNETDNTYDVQILSFLIDGALLGRKVKFPLKPSEYSDDDQDDLAAQESPVPTETEVAATPALNAGLMTAEEHTLEPGVGMLLAASRLGLIYLANISTMEKLLLEHAQEAVKLFEVSQEDAVAKSQLNNRIEELAQRLARILRGEDPRYMATAWFTDPHQLRQVLYEQLHAEFGEDSDEDDWTTDPMRAQCSWFLKGVVLILEAATDATPQEQITQQFTDHIRRHVALFLNLPEALYPCHSQPPDAQPADTGAATTTNA
jgi:hypothetical protein